MPHTLQAFEGDGAKVTTMLLGGLVDPLGWKEGSSVDGLGVGDTVGGVVGSPLVGESVVGVVGASEGDSVDGFGVGDTVGGVVGSAVGEVRDVGAIDMVGGVVGKGGMVDDKAEGTGVS